MMSRKRYNKGIIQEIANARINFLFKRAHEIYPNQKDLANRYISLARRYAQKAKIEIPPIWKKRICHKCKNFLYPGLNCRVRLHSLGKATHVSMTCLDCNKTNRYYIKTKNI